MTIRPDLHHDSIITGDAVNEHSNARCLARLLSYAASQAKELNASKAETLIWRSLVALNNEKNLNIVLQASI